MFKRSWALLLLFIGLSACISTAPVIKKTPLVTLQQVPQSVPTLSEPSPISERTEIVPTLTSTSAVVQPTLSPALTGPVERVRAADSMPQILIPEGKFWMGCDPDHNDGFECMGDELPLHEVRLDAYWIDKYEVTNGRYALCVAEGACLEPFYQSSATRPDYYQNLDFADYPVTSISWKEAHAYCGWVGGRLPTEAEWVKTARGTDLRAYPWGDQSPTCELANSLDEVSGQLCVGDTSPVGSYPLGASPYGVMDMAGNVWEWTADWYHQHYYAFSPLENPQGPERGGTKVIHGGAWDYSWKMLRNAYTSDHLPGEHKLTFGFRCVGGE